MSHSELVCKHESWKRFRKGNHDRARGLKADDYGKLGIYSHESALHNKGSSCFVALALSLGTKMSPEACIESVNTIETHFDQNAAFEEGFTLRTTWFEDCQSIMFPLSTNDLISVQGVNGLWARITASTPPGTRDQSESKGYAGTRGPGCTGGCGWLAIGSFEIDAGRESHYLLYTCCRMLVDS